MHQAIYYTFSTIPQVLAGAIALLGVFTIYKINMIDNLIKGIGNAVLLELGANRKASKSVLEHNPHLIERLKKSIEISDSLDIMKQLEEIVTAVPTESMIEKVRKRCDRQIKSRIHLIKRTKLSLIVSSVCIVTSVLILPFSKNINCQTSFLIICIFGLMFFAICIFFIVFTVYTSLTQDKS